MSILKSKAKLRETYLQLVGVVPHRCQKLVPRIHHFVEEGQRVLNAVLRIEDETHLEKPARRVDVLRPHLERRKVHIVGELSQSLLVLSLLT